MFQVVHVNCIHESLSQPDGTFLYELSKNFPSCNTCVDIMPLPYLSVIDSIFPFSCGTRL